MTNWTSGYVADVGYTHGFYRELTPTFLAFAALANGRVPHDTGAPFTYCELGSGQGLSMNILASANPHGHFYATDFNPGQIAGARALAGEARIGNLRFYDTAFAEFADEPSLPAEFDFIALHGIYSWISEENRAAIVDFIRRKLKVGGMVYISYNALPGWASGMPLRRIFFEQANQSRGATEERIGQALEFVNKLKTAQAGYSRPILV